MYPQQIFIKVRLLETTIFVLLVWQNIKKVMVNDHQAFLLWLLILSNLLSPNLYLTFIS